MTENPPHTGSGPARRAAPPRQRERQREWGRDASPREETPGRTQTAEQTRGHTQPGAGTGTTRAAQRRARGPEEASGEGTRNPAPPRRARESGTRARNGGRAGGTAKAADVSAGGRSRRPPASGRSRDRAPPPPNARSKSPRSPEGGAAARTRSAAAHTSARRSAQPPRGAQRNDGRDEQHTNSGGRQALIAPAAKRADEAPFPPHQ